MGGGEHGLGERQNTWPSWQYSGTTLCTTHRTLAAEGAPPVQPLRAQAPLAALGSQETPHTLLRPLETSHRPPAAPSAPLKPRRVVQTPPETLSHEV